MTLEVKGGGGECRGSGERGMYGAKKRTSRSGQHFESSVSVFFFGLAETRYNGEE